MASDEIMSGACFFLFKTTVKLSLLVSYDKARGKSTAKTKT